VSKQRICSTRAHASSTLARHSNTYLRRGTVELRSRIPVHLVCYFRYYVFFPNGARPGARKAHCVVCLLPVAAHRSLH
jgi:hypothetical protein